MSLKDRYPNLLSRISDEIFDLRDLIVVDENYDDIDSDEFDIFDPEDYNFLVYIPERVQEAMGKEKFDTLAKKIESTGIFEEFFAAEEDMYGLRCDLDEEGVAHKILEMIEEEISC